jgi:hypothetical protein
MLMSKPTGPLSTKKLAAKLRSPTSPSALSSDTLIRRSTDGRRPSEAAIDPLSQVCLYEKFAPVATANCISTHSKSYREQTPHPPSTRYDYRTPNLPRCNFRPRPMKQTQTRSRVENRHETLAEQARQTRSEHSIQHTRTLSAWNTTIGGRSGVVHTLS